MPSHLVLSLLLGLLGVPTGPDANTQAGELATLQSMRPDVDRPLLGISDRPPAVPAAIVDPFAPDIRQSLPK